MREGAREGEGGDLLLRPHGLVQHVGLQGEGEEEEEDAAPQVRVEDTAPVRAHLLGARGAVGGEGWGEGEGWGQAGGEGEGWGEGWFDGHGVAYGDAVDHVLDV